MSCDLCHGYRGRVVCPECDDDEPTKRDEPEPPDDHDYGRAAPREG